MAQKDRVIEYDNCNVSVRYSATLSPSEAKGEIGCCKGAKVSMQWNDGVAGFLEGIVYSCGKTVEEFEADIGACAEYLRDGFSAVRPKPWAWLSGDDADAQGH